ncbi:ATPase P [Longibacter salinarum]|uniref:ATPase P n=1 Tax=Longibacter salinarum TaxID=1850348 RepID=A0A2A8CWT7_9BACT|nr:heavy metal translocating P-type ATPase [Longibacter salinarum]PEN13199.1 ATPase P [Longibacter salinarum]
MPDYCDHCGLPVGSEPVSSSAATATYCCYGCRMLGETEARGYAIVDERQHHLLVRVFAGLLMAAFVMVLSLAVSSEYGFAAFRELQHDVGTAHWVLLLVAVPALLLLGLPVARSAIADLRHQRLSLHVLFALGTSSAVSVSAVSYVRGTGPVYIETAVTLLAIYTLGRYLTARAKGRTTAVLRHLLDVPEATYERLRPSRGHVDVGMIEQGDVVRVAAGDIVPVDGVIEEGSVYVDESSLTGEAKPAVREPGDEVYAGTSVVDGPIVLRAVAVGEDRRLARIEQMMHRALASPPRLQRLTDRIMRTLIPGVIVLALATFAGWYAAAGFEKALYTALSVVLITCPCALGIAIPLSLVVGLGEASRDGILIRDGDALLDLAQADTFVFDKTGTLTALDAPSVDVFVDPSAPASGWEVDARQARHLNATVADTAEWTEERVLHLAAALEATSRHPIGHAIQEQVAQVSSDAITEAETIPGAGVIGTWTAPGGASIRVGIGNDRIVERLSARMPTPLQTRRNRARSEGRTAVTVVVGDRAVAVITLTERMRDGAREAMNRLREKGVRPLVMTGDRGGAAERLQKMLGVPVQAGVTPEEKADRVRQLQAEGAVVAMVGDGINDAAAIAKADVGMARTDGAGVSIDAADIALYHPDADVVADLFMLARETRRIIHQNLWWTFGYNAVGLGMAVAGLLHPIAAVVVMAGSSGLVTWNAFRLKRRSPTSTQTPDA